MCDLGQNFQKLMDVTISLALLVWGSAKCKWAKHNMQNTAFRLCNPSTDQGRNKQQEWVLAHIPQAWGTWKQQPLAF